MNDRGVVGLPCVTHTCGMTRLEIPEGEFFAFYTLPHCSRELYRHGWTVVNFGLNVWLSVPRFGPREWWSNIPVSCSFLVRGHLRERFGQWLGVAGSVLMGVRYEGIRATTLVTRVLRSNLRVYGIRRVAPREGDPVVSTACTSSQDVALGPVIVMLCVDWEARTDVSVLGLNLYALSFSHPRRPI